MRSADERQLVADNVCGARAVRHEAWLRNGAMFPDWQGSALIGGLAGQALVRLELTGDRVTGEARYMQGQARVRDVAVAPDGAVMILTDGDNGALIRLTPQD